MARFLALLACLPLTALALPSVVLPSHHILPRSTMKVAFDEDNNQLIAFDADGNNLGAYAVNATSHHRREASAGTCTQMSEDDLSKVKGIQTLRDAAKKNWGDGWDKETVNDEDFPEQPANVCVDDSGAQIIYNDDADRSCRHSENKASGSLENGKITIENQEGINLQTTTEVTRSSSFSVGRTFSTKFSFPGIVDISQEISVKSEVTNTNSHSNTVASDSRTRTRVQQNVTSDDCNIILSTDTCDIKGSASLKMTATGMVWYEYGSKKDGHYKWALSLDTMLPNTDDRSSTVEFKSSGSLSSSSHFSSSGCTE